MRTNLELKRELTAKIEETVKSNTELTAKIDESVKGSDSKVTEVGEQVHTVETKINERFKVFETTMQKSFIEQVSRMDLKNTSAGAKNNPLM